MQAYWLVVRVLLTPPAEAAASQKWKIIYLQVLSQLERILFGPSVNLFFQLVVILAKDFTAVRVFLCHYIWPRLTGLHFH